MFLSSDSLQTQEKYQRADFTGVNPPTVKSITGNINLERERLEGES